MSTDLYIYKDMEIYMKNMLKNNNTKTDSLKIYFKNEQLEDFNKAYVAKNRKYNIDRYGLIIREDAYNTMAAYGWKLIDDEPINSNVIEYVSTNADASDEDIFNYGLNTQKSKKLTFTPKSIPMKIYKLLDIVIPIK